MATRTSHKKTEVIHQPDCASCASLCCRHIAIQLDTPTTKTDYDHLRWFLMHEGVKVGIDDDNTWLIEVPTPCKNLKDHRCTIYSRRPQICRNFPPNGQSCEHEARRSPYKVLFKTATALERYLDAKKVNWRFKDHQRSRLKRG